jgi:hypothetical protein
MGKARPARWLCQSVHTRECLHIPPLHNSGKPENLEGALHHKVLLSRARKTCSRAAQRLGTQRVPHARIDWLVSNDEACLEIQTLFVPHAKPILQGKVRKLRLEVSESFCARATKVQICVGCQDNPHGG